MSDKQKNYLQELEDLRLLLDNSIIKTYCHIVEHSPSGHSCPAATQARGVFKATQEEKIRFKMVEIMRKFFVTNNS